MARGDFAAGAAFVVSDFAFLAAGARFGAGTAVLRVVAGAFATGVRAVDARPRVAFAGAAFAVVLRAGAAAFAVVVLRVVVVFAAVARVAFGAAAFFVVVFAVVFAAAFGAAVLRAAGFAAAVRVVVALRAGAFAVFVAFGVAAALLRVGAAFLAAGLAVFAAGVALRAAVLRATVGRAADLRGPARIAIAWARGAPVVPSSLLI